MKLLSRKYSALFIAISFTALSTQALAANSSRRPPVHDLDNTAVNIVKQSYSSSIKSGTNFAAKQANGTKKPPL